MRPLPWLDSARALGAFLVVVYHVLHNWVFAGELEIPHVIVQMIGTGGRIAVLMFIVLSGYLLGRHWRTRDDGFAADAKLYAKRRAWRILPPYFAAITATIAVMLLFGLKDPSGTPWDYGLPLDVPGVIANYLLITDVLGWVPLSHPLWTIPVEVHLYILGPLVVLLKGPRAIGLGLVLALLCMLVIPFPAPAFPFVFVVCFWAGLKRIETETWVLREWLPELAALFMGCAVVTASGFALGTSSASIKNFAAVDTVVAPLILFLVVRSDLRPDRTWVLRAMSWKPLVWWGHRSYSLYLTHAITIELVWRWWPAEPAGWGQFLLQEAVAFPLSLLVGALFYRWVELPAAAKSAGVGRARPAPSARPEEKAT